VREQLEPGSRMFLVKQGHDSVACQLNLKGFGEELAVISGRASTVELAGRLITELGSRPEAWLAKFFEQAIARPSGASDIVQ